jgi:hypothetical protein
MYKSAGKLTSDINSLNNYVEGFDVYNSSFLRLLNKPGVEKVDYLITVYEYRPDLIAKDIYGDSGYEGILMAQMNIGLESYTRGTYLKVIPKEIIDEFIKSM